MVGSHDTCKALKGGGTIPNFHFDGLFCFGGVLIFEVLKKGGIGSI